LCCPDSGINDCQVRASGLDIPDETGKLIKVVARPGIVTRLRVVSLPKLGNPQVLEITADTGLGRVYALGLQQVHQLGLALDRLALQDRQDGLLAPLAGFYRRWHCIYMRI
jgi:hypothetical protein